MKKITLLAIILISINNIFAQKTTKGHINWQKAVKENVDNISSEYLYFENAFFSSPEKTIPEYKKTLVFNYPVKVSDLQLNIISYEKLSQTESKILKSKKIDTKSIKQDLRYTIGKSANQYVVNIYFSPVVVNSGEVMKIKDFELQYKITQTADKNIKSNTYKTSSVLASGKWLKIAVASDNVYKLTYDTLAHYGIAGPEGVRVFTAYNAVLPEVFDSVMVDDLDEIAVQIEKGSDGVFNSGDYILFYAKGPQRWEPDFANNIFNYKEHLYSDRNYLFITAGTPKTVTDIASLDESTANKTIDYYNYYNIHNVNSTNLIHSGKLFVGEHFTPLHLYETISFNIFPEIYGSSNVNIKASMVSRSVRTSSFKLTYGSSYTSVSFDPISVSGYVYAKQNSVNWNFTTSSSSIPVKFTYSYNDYDPGSEGWLDYVQLNTLAELRYSSRNFTFRTLDNVGSGNISTYKISGVDNQIKVWDVSDIFNSKNIQYNLSGSELKFTINDDYLHEFAVFYPYKATTPVIIGTVANQNLHETANYDMIIVSHPDFLTQANELADIHRNTDNLTVKVVTPQQIFNEFSSGKPDVAAIRNYFKMIYDRSVGQYPKYALLFGDGSFDNKTPNSNGNTNYILTYQSSQSLSKTGSYVSDDFFAILDNNEAISGGFCDIGIGRMPVSSVTQAQQMLKKIKDYLSTSTFGSWRNDLTFLADDEDGNLHMSQADSLSRIVNRTYPLYNINKIYLDAYEQISTPSGERYPDVNRAISDAMDKGNLIFNYTGHGNELGLAHERILTINEINAWENPDKLPLFITATCEFSRWDDYTRVTAGEYVYLNPKGGAIAMLTTTRLVYASQNFLLNSAFYNYAFGVRDYHFGDLVRITKMYSGNSTNKRNFSLLGDPALKLPYADYNIVTTSLNNEDIANADTLKALSYITIEGKVTDFSNQDVDYNGIVYPVIFDKYKHIVTLGNGGTAPFDFNTQNSIIFKGKATVTNGKFSFSFIVPKDIAYNYGFGKISYYAKNSAFDASGYDKSIVIGGTSSSTGSDNKGPDIDLYLNDNNFVYGGLTNSTPILLANIFDESGINTVGNGIGHDISAIIDKNTANSINLNEFYESETDNFKKGNVKYQLSKLSAGTHSLSLKAWDVYNNSSEAYIEFVVAESEKLALKHIFNYPNPFTTNTDFYFDHNMPGVNLKVRISIFTISGKLVKTLDVDMNTDCFRSSPINWNGHDEFGDQLAKGVYIYKIKVETNTGDAVEKYEKLVLLK